VIKLSLKKKIILLVLGISVMCPIIAGVIIYNNAETNEQYQIIANKSLPRTREMGEVLFNFRQVRIQFRSLVIKSNSSKDTETYLSLINDSVEKFTQSKDNLLKLMSETEEERKMSQEVEASWKVFAAFGGQLLELQKKSDEASYDKMAELVRYTCPELAKKLENSVLLMIKWQEEKAIARTQKAMEQTKFINVLSIALTIIGFIGSLIIGFFFTSSLSNKLIANVGELKSGAHEIYKKSDDVASIANKLSEAATEQAASLQETVASIDEISAMVSRNSDSAQSSSKTSEVSTRAAQKGKENVELMMESINSIATSNNEIIEQMQRSNKEISEIVSVIKDISQKTQVINDIVFQTKLLSFNASVEAARAGEHGKGFAVVAEEVGNLASMSGKAATEITDMLTKSVKKVTDIVDGTKSLMDNMIKQSKEKVEIGTNTAKECARSLDDILANVSSVNEMVREIATASQEQSTGVREVNKAMSQLDEVTQQNSASSQESSHAASDLKEQVERLNMVVSQLLFIIEGKSSVGNIPVPKTSIQNGQNVVQFKPNRNTTRPSTPPIKKVVGMSFETPSKDDSRFEDA